MSSTTSGTVATPFSRPQVKTFVARPDALVRRAQLHLLQQPFGSPWNKGKVCKAPRASAPHVQHWSAFYPKMTAFDDHLIDLRLQGP